MNDLARRSTRQYVTIRVTDRSGNMQFQCFGPATLCLPALAEYLCAFPETVDNVMIEHHR